MLSSILNVILAGTLTGIYLRVEGVKGFMLYLGYVILTSAALAELVKKISTSSP